MSPTLLPQNRWHAAGEGWRFLLNGFLDLIYPPVCHLCGTCVQEDGPGRLCQSCLAGLQPSNTPACVRCACSVGPHQDTARGCPRCRDESFQFDRALRFGPYEGLLREAILQLKRLSGEDLADVLVELWLKHRVDDWSGLLIDVVVPVPLHWTRRLERGFNQAEALATSLATRLGKPCRQHWLCRRRATLHQAAQTARQRRANLQGSFYASPRRDLRGRTILLVDDVMTTGSTCNDAARALRQAGAAHIVIAAIGRSEG